MFKITNIKAKTPTANHTRNAKTKETAINWASATSEFFHGIFEVRETVSDTLVCYYKDGKRYNKLDSIW